MPDMKDITHASLAVDNLGPCRIKSPLDNEDDSILFVDDKARIVINPHSDDIAEYQDVDNKPPSFEKAGPRKQIFFDPSKTKAAIVACGGLCPGINSLTRAIVLELFHIYGVRNLLGIRYGLQGFIPDYGHEIIELTPKMVTNIHGRGGSFLGMSRGPQDVRLIVDAIERQNIGILFTIGGDGTIRASQKIQEEIKRRNLKTTIIGIPKTIDNDINFVSRTFGFDSAVEAASVAISSAHNEAISVPNGIGLVKVMGRHAGFVAANTVLAQPDVNFCLIPEVKFKLDGDNGFLHKLETRLAEREHAVILIAEGAGQDICGNGLDHTDPSGNAVLADIGIYLKEKINKYFADKNIDVTLKYIDPSYIIRSVPANSTDRIFCNNLGQMAVHAAMTGKTGMIISYWNHMYVHVPFQVCTSRQKFVDPKGSLYRSVREITGQGRLDGDE